MIELVKITKRYGEILVLDEVSLRIAKGESTALLGPSGCGKTTILRIIAGLEPIESGNVSLRCCSCSKMQPHRRGISMMFQSPALWPHLTVWQNIELVAGKGNRKDISEMLENLEIGDIAQRYPHQISGGQARRASLARTLSAQADIVLMDEPFAHLGEKLAIKAASVAISWLEKSRATLVAAGHDRILARLLNVQSVVTSEGSDAMRGELAVQRGVFDA